MPLRPSENFPNHKLKAASFIAGSIANKMAPGSMACKFLVGRTRAVELTMIIAILALTQPLTLAHDGVAYGPFLPSRPEYVERMNLRDSDSIPDGAQQEIVASLEKAQQFLQRAETVRVTVGNCKSQINAAVNSLTWVETSLLEDDVSNAMSQLTGAKKILSDCNAALGLSTVKLGKAQLYLTNKAMNHIEQAVTSLTPFARGGGGSSPSQGPGGPTGESGPDTKSVETRGRGGEGDNINVCTVDGTTCQFSKCGSGKGLGSCSFGFAAGVTGGAGGQIYTVTNNEDNSKSPSPGSLRYGVNQGGYSNGGVWIVFSRDMIIVLQDMLWLRSATTVDGRGYNITVTGRNLVLGGVSNVILHNLQINSMGESDTVHIFSGSSKIWVDHITSFDAKLGLVSVLQGSTDVTISNCWLSNPNFNMLLGASDADTEDKNMRVTVFRNWFKDSMQRMPHCRWGYCHVMNNLYTNWGYYALGARVQAKILSEANVFIAGRRSEVTPWFEGDSSLDMTATIQSVRDLYLNGTTFHQFLTFGTASEPAYRVNAHYPPLRPTSTLTPFVERCAGSLFGPKQHECTSFMA